MSKKIYALTQEAINAFSSSNLASAKIAYLRILEERPDLPHIWIELGHCLTNMEEVEQAKQAYVKAGQIEPANVEPILSIARLCLTQKDEAGAVEYYRRALILDPKNAEAAAGIETQVEGKGLAPARTLPTFPVEPMAKHHPVLPENLSIGEVQKQLDSHYFHHGMDFGDGLVTKSAADIDFVTQVASAFFHPINLTGKSILDIGAWTGAYSFAAKRRGAQRVVASDHYVWTHPHFRAREAFDLALKLTGLDIEAKQIDLPDITPASVGKFDVVLFSGVFYHLINAVHLTRQISACAEHLLILETHHDALDNPRPSMVFYPGTTLQGDGSNWWGPNPHCVYELLLEFGFSDIWYCDGPRVPDRGIYHAFRNEQSRKVMGWKPDGPWLSLSDPANRAIIFAPTASGH